MYEEDTLMVIIIIVMIYFFINDSYDFMAVFWGCFVGAKPHEYKSVATVCCLVSLFERYVKVYGYKSTLKCF